MMRVRMLIPRRWQDVGTERLLDRGQVYDLPEVVASALIATQAAEHEVSMPPVYEMAVEYAPETKPVPRTVRKAGWVKTGGDA